MKADITISKSMTIKTGQYENIKPTVSITLKDVDVEKLIDINNQLSEITTNFFVIETAILIVEQDSINKNTIDRYARTIRAKMDDIISDTSSRIEIITRKLS